MVHFGWYQASEILDKFVFFFFFFSCPSPVWLGCLNISFLPPDSSTSMPMLPKPSGLTSLVYYCQGVNISFMDCTLVSFWKKIVSLYILLLIIKWKCCNHCESKQRWKKLQLLKWCGGGVEYKDFRFVLLNNLNKLIRNQLFVDYYHTLKPFLHSNELLSNP